MIEEDNLQTVHKRLKAWPQPHVASFISSIQIGKDDEEAHRYLVFKAADANLGEILFGKVNLLSQQKTAPAAPTPFVVMKELRGLAKGLSWLHSALDDKEHKVPRICHFDIKPSNILVWWRDGERYWRLKYADFGISSTGYHEEFPQDIESTRTLRTRVRQERAEYQPPEVEENIPVGRSVDVWSYGCLLFEILGFTIEGPTQAKKFQVIRRERYKTRTFYYKDNGESKLIPEIASFLTAWKKKVSWILGWAELVEDILKIDPSERPKAKDLEWRTDKLMDQLERRIDCGKPLPWTLASDASHEANHHQSAAQAPSNARSLPARSSPHTQNLSWNVDSLHVDTQPPIPKLKHPAKRARWTPGADKVVLQKESHVCFLDPGTSVITPIELGNVSLIRAFAVGGKYAAILYEAGESQQVSLQGIIERII
ncbi:kinase-like protein [Viridothelium virens]|uniref:non-specific serine/threonine protein kinase n=1 Tax=Viridothelium virens TaxID=1048519 RepID=A0A6A6H5N5_VIRVR|nr:kinase-like protein [Viridothelium virens]